jgi:hypothetical protein
MILADLSVWCSPASLGWALLLFAIAWNWRSLGQPEGALQWTWWLLVGGVLLCFRWPLIWLPHELHPDEGQVIAGAITLRYDPMFWRSVDGNTAGPLDFFPLLPAAFAAGTASYAVARLAAVAMIWGTLVATGEALALVTTRAVARLAVLPFLAFESLTTSPEFVPYSTELAPVLLLAAAVYLILRQATRPSVTTVWLAALLLGAVPFSKLQAAPMAAVLWLLLAGQEIRSGRRSNLGRLFAGAALPVLAVGVLTAVTGQTENFLIPYVLHNFEYVQGGRQSVGVVVLKQWEQAVTNGYLALWLAGSAVFLVATLSLAGRAPAALRRLRLAAAVLLATAIVCMLAPGRPYHHYFVLFILPLSLLLGLTLAMARPPDAARARARPLVLAGLFLACGVAPQLAWRASSRPDPFAYYNTADRGPAHRELAAAVRALSAPGEALGLWGWRSSLYVESGRRQATRQAHNEAQLVTGPWQGYFLGRYLKDIQASRPPVFVDPTGPGNFRFDDRKWGHEIFPPLRDWVRIHYTFFVELDGARIYVRNDRLAAARRAWPLPHP